MIRITYLHESDGQQDLYCDEDLLEITLATMFKSGIRVISITR